MKIGGEYPGPITAKIAGHYSEILTGNVENRRDWLIPV
jgi:hypothetical protein